MPVDFGNVWVVMRREFLERVRKKSFLIMTIVTPLLFGALMILPGVLAVKGPQKVSAVAVLDETGWAGSLLLSEPAKTAPREKGSARGGAEGRPDPAQFSPAAKGATLEGEKARILAKEIDGLLVLEPDEKAGLKGTFYGQNLGDINLQEFIQWRMSGVAMKHRLEVKGLDPALAAELQRKVVLEAVKVEKGGTLKTGSFLVEYFKAIMFAMLLYMLIVMYGWALMRGVMEEKTSKIVEVLLSSVRPFELLLGKIVGIASVGLVQYAIWFVLGLALYLANPANLNTKVGSGMVKPGELVLLVIFFVLGFFFYASIYAAAGSVCTTDQEAQQVQLPIVMCLILPVMLGFLVTQDPDATWLVVLSFIPLFAPTLTVMRVSLVEVPMWQIAGSLLSLAVGVVLMAYVSGKIYKVGVLMTGKRPTVPEIIRWIRAK